MGRNRIWRSGVDDETLVWDSKHRYLARLRDSTKSLSDPCHEEPGILIVARPYLVVKNHLQRALKNTLDVLQLHILPLGEHLPFQNISSTRSQQIRSKGARIMLTRALFSLS